MTKRVLIIVIAVLALTIPSVFLIQKNQATSLNPVPLSSPTNVTEVTKSPTTAPKDDESRRVKARDISGAHANFTFSVEIPIHWQVEAVPAVDAINFYDSSTEGTSNLEKSQIFMRYFSASDFLTLSTVTIYSKEKQTFNSRPAVRYDIEKKATMANFANQPSWRNGRHIVTDIRVGDLLPSVFYVIAKNPKLDELAYQDFLTSMRVNSLTKLTEPTQEFTTRITKKKFATKVSPTNSPVSPERFSGYHTGVDVEFGDVSGDVAVKAIAEAKVALSKTVDGYGGTTVLNTTIGGVEYHIIYGHLDSERLPDVDKTFLAGETIGYLGEVGPDTDGERKHLHLGISKKVAVDLSGYVSSVSDLADWLDPLKQF